MCVRCVCEQWLRTSNSRLQSKQQVNTLYLNVDAVSPRSYRNHISRLQLFTLRVSHCTRYIGRHGNLWNRHQISADVTWHSQQLLVHAVTTCRIYAPFVCDYSVSCLCIYCTEVHSHKNVAGLLSREPSFLIPKYLGPRYSRARASNKT